jgi:hypothetical protein
MAEEKEWINKNKYATIPGLINKSFIDNNSAWVHHH